MLKNLFKATFVGREVESDDCFESDSNSGEYKENILFYAKNVMNKNNNQIHAILDSNALHLMKIWALNRHINRDDLNYLKGIFIEDIKSFGYPRLFDPIHLCHFCDENGDNVYEIIDGQHRYKALLEIHEEFNFENFDVVVEIHKVNNETEKMELLDKINCRKQINRNDLIDYKIPSFIDMLERYWLNNFKTKIYGINRPFICRTKLQKNLKNISEKLEKYNLNDLLEKFIFINREISKRTQKNQCGKSSCPKKLTFDKAKSKNFFLGLDKNMEWIEMIN